MKTRTESTQRKGAPSVRRMLGCWAVAALMLWLVPASARAEETPKPADETTAVMEPTRVPETAVESVVMGGSGKVERKDTIELQHFRAHDTRGLNVFEPPKKDSVTFEGKKLMIGFAFAQQFQGLRHENTALPRMTTVNGQNVNANQLMEIGYGFNNATANLYLDAQLARGIRVSMTSYLSSRHHQETWVKDGYLLVDASPIDKKILNDLMKYVTLRIGHFEINYGDAHFRRSDNGNAIFNPFVGNLLMDAFTTEVGAEAYVRAGDVLAMAGLTGGEIRGQVQRPNDRSNSYIGKLGFDRQLTPEMRVRLTSSVYVNRKAINSTLYSGSRAGSRYYSVLENAQSTETAQAWSGDVQPGFRNKVTAWVINPFVKFRDLELFGNVEQAKGKAATEAALRTWDQYSADAVYRFYDERFYGGARYNVAKGELAGITNEVEVERLQAGGGWFLTPAILLKGEYVRENYMKFPANDQRNGGRFDGFMVEGVVVF